MNATMAPKGSTETDLKQAVAPAVAAGGMVQRASGVIVPAGLELENDTSAPAALKPGKSPTTYDPDGRRRVVLTKDDQRLVDRAILVLRQRGFGILVMCSQRDDDKAPCEQPMLNEVGGPDPGYGCKCSRVHFR